MKKLKCSTKECKELATAFIKGEPVCQYHFKQQKKGKPEHIPSWLDKYIKK
jgi:hypothetical protein